MKRSHRVGAICQILTESPERVFNLKYFCDRFSAAKSSISEDISAAKEAVEATGYGYIETIPGAAGGVKYVPELRNRLRKCSSISVICSGKTAASLAEVSCILQT